MTYPHRPNSMAPFDIHSDHNDLSETEFLKNSIANHTKYGSTNCNFASQNYRFITHYIESTDTFQGLSLKYGCKIEDIKKFNKLFSDDNNHLRSRFSIVVPMETKTKIQFDSQLDGGARQTPTQSSPKTGDEAISYNNGSFTNSKASSKSPKIVDPWKNSHSFDNAHRDMKANNTDFKSKSQSFSDTNNLNDPSGSVQNRKNESVADFLIRIDSSIARTKDQVECLSKRAASGSIENELNKINSKRFNTPRLTTERSLFSPTSSKSLFDQEMPHVTVNCNKKIKSSLKRLEKSQEEIFEL